MGEIIRWVAGAFFWGIGIFFVYFVINAIVDEFVKGKSTWVLVLVFSIMGAFVKIIYDKSFGEK